MRVLVMGAGGVGGYYGARLAAAGHNVSLVARGAHLAAIQRAGLRVTSGWGEFGPMMLPASDDPASLGPADLVLFCVKAYDNEPAARQLVPVLTDTTAILSLQNGIDNETIIEAIVGAGRVLGGSCRIISTIAEPGLIDHMGRGHRLDFGEMNGSTSPRCEALLAAFTAAGLDAHLSPDIAKTLWEKFLGLDPVSCISAAARCTIGEVFANDYTLMLHQQAMREIMHLAAAEGIDLGGESAVQNATNYSRQQVASTGTTSLYRDVVAGKRLEIDALAGAAVRLGDRHGIETPVHDFLYAVLYPAQRRALAAAP